MVLDTLGRIASGKLGDLALLLAPVLTKCLPGEIKNKASDTEKLLIWQEKIEWQFAFA
jgi:hypothetical protein